MSFNFTPFPPFTTKRLLLRQLSLEDAHEIFLLRSDPIVNKHLGRTPATSVDDATAFIEKINTYIANNQSIFWGISFKEKNKLIGTICLWTFSEEENKAESGYELLPQFHGKGIMQEAFLKVMEFGFQTLLLNSVDAWTVQQNKSSIKILERNHFKRNIKLETKIDWSVVGPDCIIFSLARDNYLNCPA